MEVKAEIQAEVKAEVRAEAKAAARAVAPPAKAACSTAAATRAAARSEGQPSEAPRASASAAGGPRVDSEGGSDFGQRALLRRLHSAPEHAPGCSKLRPASAHEPLLRLWLGHTRALLPTQAGSRTRPPRPQLWPRPRPRRRSARSSGCGAKATMRRAVACTGARRRATSHLLAVEGEGSIRANCPQPAVGPRGGGP